MTAELEQGLLFDMPTTIDGVWGGMPRFAQSDLEPMQSVMVHFASVDDRRRFSELLGQTVTPLTRSLWYPRAEIGRYVTKAFRTPTVVNPTYPVYVISKGRADSRLTVRSLDAMGVPYHVVIEPQEYEQYARVIAPARILTLPFSNLGQGSIPARNWVWEHAKATGARRHWILDDNINGFFRLHNNLKTPVLTGATFRAIEDFADRYENVALAGMNYFMFASRKSASIVPVTLNTRIYSCILIDNALEERWRGRYNEDTDLSLRVLKRGLSTALFNAFLCGKSPTMKMAGGNTDELYVGDGRLKMAESLVEQHPDVTTVVWKWGRHQHEVDYAPFRRNTLVLRRGAVVPEEPNDYGMELHEADPDERIRPLYDAERAQESRVTP